MGAPPWFRSAIIYQIYPRVYGMKKGKFGTLREIQRDLPRIQSLGVNTLYLLPIQPSGQIQRKGIAGSPYAIADYKGIASEYTEQEGREPVSEEERAQWGKEQFRDLVREAHSLGMRVLLDFVGNHCAPDNVLLDPENPPEKGGYHPEWFLWSDGPYPIPSNQDWSDTAELNYGIPIPGKPNFDRLRYDDDRIREAMWQYMISVLEYWIKEFDIDGYRCDFAHWVPLEFWQRAITQVKEIKPEVVFVAEAYERLKELLESGFDGVYAFELYNQLKSLHHDIRHGDPYFEIRYIEDKINWECSHYPRGTSMVRYTENHDEVRSVIMYGGIERSKPPFLLALTLPGVPMLYAGQENGAYIRPPLFEGNFGENEFRPIDFQTHPELLAWYRHVLAIRSAKAYLQGEEIRFFPTSNRKVSAFLRKQGDAMALVMINFNAEPEAEPVQFELPPEVYNGEEEGHLVDLLDSGIVISLTSGRRPAQVTLQLAPLQSVILEVRRSN
ncbi:hypothetical protein H1S01_07105 [Heliobacterium chlorum]|uniref:Glycosyl hydrolase family 13 catalytic domain-containing protein n=1 Tax=Heliobacterium chlorum TaxID=2698 RepID=A0ABR7T0G0_HELCL|nr:hypothetical protein [Heliobacterium chlorum]